MGVLTTYTQGHLGGCWARECVPALVQLSLASLPATPRGVAAFSGIASLSPSLPRPMHTLPACSEGPAPPSPALGENTRACRQAPQRGARWAGVILEGLREQVPCGGSYLEQPQQLLPRMGPSGSTRKGGEELPSPTI